MGYRYGMLIVVIVVIIAIVLAIAVVLGKRRANQKAEELRHQAQDHRDEARASQAAATRQETEANALAAKAKGDLAMAEQQRSAAAVKREVATDLNVRADNIDPDVPNTNP
jgi:predicted Holliday junction resolvase-like endonuclease